MTNDRLLQLLALRDKLRSVRDAADDTRENPAPGARIETWGCDSTIALHDIAEALKAALDALTRHIGEALHSDNLKTDSDAR